ncbi:MAG: cobalamin biosynthesis protein CobD [Jatrophihabitans sp.]|nr:cobalamin biosynthesis protein CobD [Jatrophihabitans sp.]
MLIGTALDAVIPDPRRGHPVAAFGRLAGILERRTWADDRVRGMAFTAVAVGGPVLAARCVERRTFGIGRVVAVAAATWAVLGARSLRSEAVTIDGQLRAGDLPAARRQLTHLVGRDPSQLDAPEIARAALESVAENSCDAVVAPLLWGAVAGLPGLVGYRAVNTLDAMVGYRSPRYERFGWASARLDDLANLVPARLTAALVAVLATTVGGQPREVLRIVRRDGRRHPSPNAGFAEAAFAGALGRQLGGRNVYDGRVEERPVMGSGGPVEPGDLARATRLAAAVTAAAAGTAAALTLLLRRAA